MKLPKTLSRLIDSFEKLPGIGPKTAQRLSFYLLRVPQSELDGFANSLANLKQTVFCSKCKNVGDADLCSVCSDPARDKKTILVVESPLDTLAFEKTDKYKGVYHVLHGSIDPLNNIGPDEIYIGDLFERIEKERPKEVIIATNPTMEGDATAMYISKQVKIKNSKIKISRLGMGIPTGADLEYADETTLTQAIEGRKIL